MSDKTTPELPRIALMFGDESAAAHLREALIDHAEIVYAAPADEFEASRMCGARAAVALVNLDNDGWLGEIETKLYTSGIAVVFNDPAISRNLEGWERARWLRHLVAKLHGSSDVDPPRPEVASQTARAVPADDAMPPETPALPVHGAVAERPLSPEEIETMTADFVAAQESSPVRTAAWASPDPVVATQHAKPLPALDLDMDFVDEPIAPSATEPKAAPPVLMAGDTPESSLPLPEPADAEIKMEGGLDVDTEALSAMIDARLKETEASMPSDSPQVWRIVTGGAVSPVQLDTVEADAAPEHDAASGIERADASASQEDADGLASLPSLDDWQLVDHEAAIAPAVAKAAHKPLEPVLSDAFAALELVPMDLGAPVEIPVDPIERWFGGAPAQTKADAAAVPPAAKGTSHERG